MTSNGKNCSVEGGWPERFTAGVAGEVSRYRQALGWSFQQLADACTELGYPTLRTTLANLENGRRKSITVHEIIVLAEALGVLPVMLLFPGLPDGEFEYLPGRVQKSWDALRHFTGDSEDWWEIRPALADPEDRRYLLAQMRALKELPRRVTQAQDELAAAEKQLDDARKRSVKVAEAEATVSARNFALQTARQVGVEFRQTLRDAGFTISQEESK